jgi:ABC-type multidrug transport system fused ATPase/permease subunit
MQKEISHTIPGYYQFFYRILGNKLLFNMFLGLGVSFLDGLGLAMFIPLLQFVGDSGSASVGSESMGSLHYLIDFFYWMHLPLNIYTILLMMVTLFTIKGVINFWQQNVQVDLRFNFMKKVRNELTDNLQHLSYISFLELDAGRIQNTMTAEVGKLLNAIVQFLASAKGAVMLLTYVFLAFMANWQFAILVAGGALLSNLLFKKMLNSVRKASIDVSAKGNRYNGYLIQAVHYFKYLKATNSLEQFSLKLRKVINDAEVLNKKIGTNQALTASLREPLVILIVAIVVSVQVRFMGSSVGSITLSILLFYRALSFLMQVQSSWQSFIQNIGSLYSVSSLNAEMEKVREQQPDTPAPAIQSGISFSNLTFSYGDHTVLKDINIHIPKNTSIALVGESGSGKTTLANIITGLLSPESGALLIDDSPLKQFNLDSYRSRIGYISQDSVIFTDTIYNNVTFWAEPEPENLKRFWDAIEQASLTGFVKKLAEGEHTKLGDHGMLISGGQKQRISIARELYKNVEIMVMDEATSALDSETERFIQESIDKLKGSYTLIVIAHRLSTIKNVDRIYLLDNGQVTAQGEYNEMLEISPKFKRMVSLQEV